jgi:hypothetical protein
VGRKVWGSGQCTRYQWKENNSTQSPEATRKLWKIIQYYGSV